MNRRITIPLFVLAGGLCSMMYALASNTLPSPNMGMPIPVVGTDPGPDWANNINASLSIVDQHDHSPGKGVPITPAGMNISSDLPFNNNNATVLRSTRFNPQSSPLSGGGADIGALYESGADLYYNDGNGNQVRITEGGAVTGSAGTITGLPSGTASASYSGGTFTFSAATNTPATMSVGPIIVSRQVPNPFGVTIAASASQGANYNLTLPTALPGSASVMTLDSSGNISSTLAPTLNGASITGGTISTSAISGGTLSGSEITSSTLDSTPIGSTTPSSGAFSNATIGPVGSAFKMKTFNGTIPATTSVTLIANGSYTTFFGIIGMTTVSGGAEYVNFGAGPASGNYIFPNVNGLGGDIRLFNNAGVSNSYTATVFFF